MPDPIQQLFDHALAKLNEHANSPEQGKSQVREATEAMLRALHRRAPREDYVRVTVSAAGYTFEPAVEYRKGDDYFRLVRRLRHLAHDFAHRAISAVQREWTSFEAMPTAEAILDRMPDPMSAANAVGEAIAKQWPDRAYFVEVWQEGREGFAQCVQPYGFPRNQ